MVVKTDNGRRNKRSGKAKKGMEKTHRCKIEGCQRSYTTEHYLINHQRSRHGVQ